MTTTRFCASCERHHQSASFDGPGARYCSVCGTRLTAPIVASLPSLSAELPYDDAVPAHRAPHAA